MSGAYRLVLGLHIIAGLIGLAAFWTPAIARKGGTTHVRVGRVFFWCTYKRKFKEDRPAGYRQASGMPAAVSRR